MSLENLIILTKLEELDAYSHQAIIQFPKYEKFVLCAEVRQTLNSLIRLTVRTAKRYYKKTTLQDLDIEIEYLRSLVRKAHRLKYISTRKYEIWIKHVNEIGKMAGDWSNGSNAGLFNLNLNNDASNTNTNNGSRLANYTARR